MVLFQDFSTMFASLIAIDSISTSAYFPLVIYSIGFIIASCFTSFRSKHVYLVDFSCYQPPDSLRVSTAKLIEYCEICGLYERESIDFQSKASLRTGIGSEACFPLPVHQLPHGKSMKLSAEEAELVFFTAVKDLLTKHNINPKSIDIIVSSCSAFSPTPSLTDRVINKFGFRSNIKSANLSGMGCGAGLVAISLAKDLLKVHQNSLALVLSMETITGNGYEGKVKSMLLSNTLFRMGGVAVLLSNKDHDKKTSKYKLKHLVRTHMASDDQSYQSVFHDDDGAGFLGLSLSKSIVHVAGNALKHNISDIGKYILPYSEQLKYAWFIIRRKVHRATGKKREIYVPNFKKGVDHFCIHAGGRGIIDAVEENLKLKKEDVEASRMTLYRFGNTSSSSVWYELCYLEAKGRMKRGEKVWQISFGSGFKCNSAVWECISEINPKKKSAWSDRIHLYPVEIPDMVEH